MLVACYLGYSVVCPFRLYLDGPKTARADVPLAKHRAALLQAACCIVSSRSSDDFDAYVLSESSLFVFTDRLMLKTCGTTELLAAVPMLIALADGLGMRPSRVKYSRASFLFPEKQVKPLLQSLPPFVASARAPSSSYRIH